MPDSSHGCLRVVGAAILDGDTCLVAQRGANSANSACKWELPGGKVESGEPPRAALRREIREELHLEIEVGSWLARSQHTDGGLKIELDIYSAHIVAGRIQLTEHDRYGWFRAEDLDDLDWTEADRQVLPELKSVLAARRPPSIR